jgi:protein-disulfide isomerase-like protein with CxxC motif
MAYPHEEFMSEVTAAEFYQALKAQTRELMSFVDDKYRDMAAALRAHEIEDRKVADLVLEIKTQREEENKQAAKNAAWVSLLVAGGVSAFFKWILK